MAKNRPEPAKSVDTDEESEQEEEEASSDENGGSDSEPEPPLTQVSRTPVTKKPSASAPKKPEPKRVSSSEESDSESDGDSDSNPNVKPIASKPMDDPKAPSAAATPTKKPRSKPAAPRPTSPTKSAAGTKRPAADGEAKESKKSKKKPSGEVESSGVKKSMTEDSKKKPTVEVENSAKKSLTEDSKKQLFQRLWSEEDEIAVLKGMIAYAEEKNADPVTDLNAFHDFIRESLHIDVTRTQLQDKIRRLKKKYENNARKEKKGKERTFSKIHEQNAYDLSKNIWGSLKAQNGSVVKAAETSKASNASARKDRIKNAVIPVKASTVAAAEVVDHVLDEEKEANANMDVDTNVEGSKSLNLSGGSLFGKSLNELAEWIDKNKVGLSEEKLIEMEGKWKALKVAELELFLKKAALIQEQGRLVLDALK
ncbi:PREDICTED: probable transcription factor At1g11510 [Ipomoea nil]|uniref:probable transcription factor At1g11510 n=1 Tax=Ipomoea nil TaxID=35883 RepID=UPI000902015B|nr:PREDICTED: probable transcription factor At1g11510 [Ipomoea nil]